MTDHDVTATLERLVEPLGDESGDWDDVLARAAEERPALEPSRNRRGGYRRRRVVVLVAAGLVVAVASTSAFGTVRDLLFGARRSAQWAGSPTWSPDGRRIAFVTVGCRPDPTPGCGNPIELNVMNADGGGLRNLTREWGLEGDSSWLFAGGSPAWSRDWRKVALVRVGAGHDGGRRAPASSIYVVNADGSRRRRLTRSPHTDGNLAWSPDGRKIAFIRIRGRIAGGSAFGGSADLYVVAADGRGLRRLAHTVAPALQAGSPNPGFGAHPVWSPDGRTIAFVGNRHGGDDVFVVNTDGSGLRNLTRSRPRHQKPVWAPDGPTWSPDGRKLAFRSDRDGSDEIYVVNADGTDLRRLTHNSKLDGGPAWSPDGRKILFWRSNRWHGGIQGDVWVMNADGSGQRNLTRSAAHPFATDTAPSWSPDGRKIVFVSNRDRNGEIYVVNADGSGERKLTRLSRQD